VDGAGNPARSDGEHGSPAIADIDGVLTSAGVRLEQLPEARRWIAVPVSTPLQVYNLVEETLAQDLNPAAIEVDLPTPTVPRTTERPPGSLAILLEGGRTEIAVRAAELAKTIGDTSMVAEFAPRWWGRYPFTRADVALRISVAIEHLHAAVYALSDAAGRPVPIRGSAGIGTVHAVLPGTLPPERVEAILEAVRHVLLARGGHAVIIAAPPHIAAEVDMAGRRDLF
jgi:glycolate oxidase FAD binding subunit